MPKNTAPSFLSASFRIFDLSLGQMLWFDPERCRPDVAEFHADRVIPAKLQEQHRGAVRGLGVLRGWRLVEHLVDAGLHPPVFARHDCSIP